MFIAGVALFTFSSLAGGFATNQGWLLAARVLQGVGGAVASPTALSLITSTFPEGPPRNKAMRVYAAMSGAGSSIGLLLGGIPTDVASWRWVLFVNVPIGIAVVLAAPRVLGESETRIGRLDLPGAASVTGGMVLLVYGLSHAASTSWSDSVTVGSLVASVIFLVAFVAIERRSPHALMPLSIFADRDRSASYGIMLVVCAGLLAMFFFLTQYVQDILGYSPLRAGLAFLPVSVMIGITAGASARLVARTGPRLPMTLGLLITAGGLFWLATIGPHSSYFAHLLGPMLTIALGMGAVFVPLTLTAVAHVRPHEAGLASALLNTGQQIGGSLGIAVLVTVATTVTRDRLAGVRHASHAVSNAAIASGYSRAFLVGALISLGGFVIALLAVRVKRDEVPAPSLTGAP
jgi:EmrB/QacA subfamily drug resistance transporter